MERHSLGIRVLFAHCLCFSSIAVGEDLWRESFDDQMNTSPLTHTWGDRPAAVDLNAVEAGIGREGSAAVHLRLRYPAEVQHNLSYWMYKLAEPVPLVPQLETISFNVKTNVPVSIKIGISPFGFIYHGPGVGASGQWQRVTLENAYEELKKWCEGGGRKAEDGWVSSVIVAVANKADTSAELIVDDIALEGAAGARDAMAAEIFARRIRRTRVAAISLIWDEGYRTLDQTLTALDESGNLGADLACLPEQCVDQPPEPIPGPVSQAIARKAAEYQMYVVGNLREQEEDKTYITSFLCDRDGNVVGKYRKSHRLPYEDDIDLGDELPVFATDFGAVGLKIGTDHFFPEIDTVLRRRGASLVVWSTKPFPLRDEHYITYALRGRAVQTGLCYAVARYAGKEGYGGYADRFSWTASWPLGRAQVFLRDGHTAADSGHRGGVALAAIPAGQLGGSPRDGGYDIEGKYALITAPELPPPPKSGDKRVIRAAAIQCDTNMDSLIAKLDACGERHCDIACLWEYVWYGTDEEVEEFKERNRQRLARIAEAAKRNNMYVVIAGELERGFNEAIVYDRQGREMGRYTKIAQTTSKESRYYRAGDRVGIFDLDFGRICTKICLDVSQHEIDRVAALHQVDLMLLSTQDAGPYSESIRLRDGHRCVDNGYYLLRAAGGGAEYDHRTYIMDPWGMVLAASQFRVDNPPVITTIDLDNRPTYFEWPEEVLAAGTHPDPVKRGIPATDRIRMYGRFNRPLARGDLRAVILKCRRPELYKQVRSRE
jgi:predicted amidohydrolase